jgi:DivIVA domain-containing protein
VPLLFGILVSAGVIFAIFAVTVGRGGSMTQFQPDWPGQPLPQDRPVRGSDLADARFSVAFRGYRMAEVDDALDRLAVEIAQRDERIQQLTGQPFEPDPATVTVFPAVHEQAYDPAGYLPATYDTTIYPATAQEPYAGAQEPYVGEPNAGTNPYADPNPYAHGYPPGVLDVGGHPTQPIQPISPDAGIAGPGPAGPVPAIPAEEG